MQQRLKEMVQKRMNRRQSSRDALNFSNHFEMMNGSGQMVKFVVENCTAIGRLGRISLWGDKQMDHRTPSCMIYTRAGHIPHLTWDVFNSWLHLLQQPIFQLTLPSFFESLSAIEKFGKGYAAFAAMPKDAATHLSILDPLGQLESGFNDNKSISIWTRAGRRNIDVKILRRSVCGCRPSTAETLLDYDTPRECTNKRLTKSVNRTLHFFKEVFEWGPPLEVPATLISLGGGFSGFHRERSALEMGKSSHVAGFAIDLMHFANRPHGKKTHAERKAAKRKASNSDPLKESPEPTSLEDSGSPSVQDRDQIEQNAKVDSQADLCEQRELNEDCEDNQKATEDCSVESKTDHIGRILSSKSAKFEETEIEKLLTRIFPHIPSTSLRYTSGAFSPSEVVALTRLGIDLFDSSYAVLLAEQGQMLRLSHQFPVDPLFSIADFNDKKFADDFSRPYEDCECYTCVHYTKGYLQHLRNTNEMLGPILLVIHNLQEYERMFWLLRKRIEETHRIE